MIYVFCDFEVSSPLSRKLNDNFMWAIYDVINYKSVIIINIKENFQYYTVVCTIPDNIIVNNMIILRFIAFKHANSCHHRISSIFSITLTDPPTSHIMHAGFSWA